MSINFDVFSRDVEEVIEKKTEDIVVKYNSDHSWDDGDPDKFAKITKEILGPVIKRDIFISVPHQKVHVPVLYNKDGEENEKMFHIFIWSSPISTNLVTPPTKVWGHEVSCRDGAYTYPNIGAPINSDDDEYAVATLFHNNLYVHHDICHNGESCELELYRLLLEKVAELYAKGLYKTEKWLQAYMDANKKKYIERCTQGKKELIARKEEEMQFNRIKVAQLQNEIVSLIRHQAKEKILLKSLKDDLENTVLSQLGDEFDKIVAMSKIKGINVTKKGFNIFTETLYCENPKTKKIHEIGKFCIKINTNPDCTENIISWNNLTRKVDAYEAQMNAPHIFASGHACLGNISEGIVELSANHQYYFLIQLAIQFVEKVNVEDEAGSYIDSWPIVGECK